MAKAEFLAACAYGNQYHSVEHDKCISNNLVEVSKFKEGEKYGKEEWKKGREKEATDCIWD